MPDIIQSSSPQATDPRTAYTNSLLQRKRGSTYYGYNPTTKEGIAFSKPEEFSKYFGSFDAKAPEPEFDTSNVDKTPNQIINLAPKVEAPATPAPAVPPVRTAREALQPFIDSYLNSLNPSDKESNARKTYEDFLTTSKLSISGQEGQGRGIVLPVIRGNQAKLREQSELTAGRLAKDVELAEMERKNTADKNLARLQFEEKLFARDEDRRKETEAKTKEEAQATKDQQEKALKFAQSGNVKTPYFFNAGTGYRTGDLKAYGSEAEMLKDMGVKTLDEARAKGLVSDYEVPTEAPKLEGSASTGYYAWNPKSKKFEIVIPASKSGSGSGGGNEFKFSSSDKSRLVGAGFTSADITNIQKDIGEFGIDRVAEGLPENQQKALRNILSGVTPTQEQKQTEDSKQFLSKDYFRKIMTKDQLKSAAKSAGFTAGGFLGIGVGDKGVEDYLSYIDGLIKQYREAGYTDQEILKLMQ